MWALFVRSISRLILCTELCGYKIVRQRLLLAYFMMFLIILRMLGSRAEGFLFIGFNYRVRNSNILFIKKSCFTFSSRNFLIKNVASDQKQDLKEAQVTEEGKFNNSALFTVVTLLFELWNPRFSLYKELNPKQYCYSLLVGRGSFFPLNFE